VKTVADLVTYRSVFWLHDKRFEQTKGNPHIITEQFHQLFWNICIISTYHH